MGTSHINLDVVFQHLTYKICDLGAALYTVERSIIKHREICDIKVSNKLENNPHVMQFDENFAILTQEMSLPAAKQACRYLGHSLVEVRTPDMAEKLAQFMVKARIFNTYAGIHMNPQTLRPVYESDQMMAMNTEFWLHPMNTNTNESMIWDEIILKLRYDDYFYQKGTSFTYQVYRLGVRLMIHYASIGNSFADSMYLNPFAK